MARVEMPSDFTDQFPGNSFSERAARRKTKARPKQKPVEPANDISSNEEAHVKRVNSVGKAKAQKKSTLKKLATSIVEDSIESVKERAYNEIVVPGLKSLLFDTIVDMADAMIFGKAGYNRGFSARTGYSSRARGGEQVSYDRYYGGRNASRPNRARPAAKTQSSSLDYTLEPDDFVVATRTIANNALKELDQCIRTYGHASIADLYDAVELTSDWTDDQYGWTDIRGARIRAVRGGFMIIMPPTVELD